MTALDNLIAQVDSLSQTLAGTVEPALTALADKAASTGISEADVQAQADRLSVLAASTASAAQSALIKAGLMAEATSAEVSATATHPEGTVVDERGNPVLDAAGQPITTQESTS